MRSFRTSSSIDWKVAVGLGLFGYMASGVLGYFHQDKSTAIALTQVQTQQSADEARLNRIEVKLDRLYEVLTGTKP